MTQDPHNRGLGWRVPFFVSEKQGANQKPKIKQVTTSSPDLKSRIHLHYDLVSYAYAYYSKIYTLIIDPGLNSPALTYPTSSALFFSTVPAPQRQRSSRILNAYSLPPAFYSTTLTSLLVVYLREEFNLVPFETLEIPK